ncbi:MAG: hypothetical protein ACREB9_01005 [Thermoplasmata archaeon]
MPFRIGRVHFGVIVGAVVVLTFGAFFLGYRWDGDLGGQLLLLILAAFAGVYLWDAARLERAGRRARTEAPPTAAAAPTPEARIEPSFAEDDSGEDPVEEADRLERESRASAKGPDRA